MIEIAPYRIEHLEQVYEIERLSFSVPWSKGIFADIPELNWVKFFVALENNAAVENNAVVGYCGMNHVLDEGEIINIAVHPDYRSQGIGDLMMREMITYSETNDIVLLMLEVRKSNTVARRLYEKYGFYEVGIRPKYYTKPDEDAVLMNKDIKFF
jgi:ribosomal-protein-alanine acetyltransferase